MRIKGIILKNFRQYKYEVITFPDEGIIGIVGTNGKGKSTIFNAIGWTFYGKVKDVLKEHIKNVNAGPREDCYVVIIFEHQGETYVIKRHLTKKDECFLKTVDGRPLVVSGRNELTSYISDRFFKMDYTTFCACYYAQQDDFDALSKLTPAKRRETLTKLLRIDTIDKAFDKTNQIIKTHKEAIEKVEYVVTKEDGLIQKKAESEDKIIVHKSAIKDAEKNIANLSESYKNLLVKRAEGDVTHQEFIHMKNDYKQQLHALRTLEERVLKQDEEELTKLLSREERYKTIQHHIDEYNQLLEEREEFNRQRSLYQEKTSLIEQLKNIKDEVEHAKIEYRSIQTEIKNEKEIYEQLNELMIQKDAINVEIQTKETQIQEYNLDIRSFKDKLKNLKDTKEKFEKLGKDSPCPMCERPLGEHFDDTMSHIKDEQEPLLATGREIQQQRDALTNEVEELKVKMNEIILKEREYASSLVLIDKKKERLSYIQQHVQSLNERYNQHLPRYQELQKVYFDAETYNKLVSTIQDTKKMHDEALSIQHTLDSIPFLKVRIDASKTEAIELKNSLSSLENDVKALNFDEVAYKTLTSEIEQIQNDIHEEKETMTKSMYEIKSLDEHIKRIKEELVEVEKTRKDIASRRNEMAFYLKLVESYKVYKMEIIAELTPDLSKIMSEYIEQVTDGFYDEIELDRDFNIYIYRLGEKKPLSFYSGGEQKLAALLQLLGVSHLLTSQTGQASFDMVAMDEVLGSFDDNRQASTIEQLRNLKEIFPQVLMVAHQDLVKDMFDYTLIVSTNEKRHSQAKWMKEWDDSENKKLLEPYLSA